MKREFINKFNKFTSLLLATVLILCSSESILIKAYAAYDDFSENASIMMAESGELDSSYGMPQPDRVPEEALTEEPVTLEIEEGFAVADVITENDGDEQSEPEAAAGIQSYSEEIRVYSAGYTLTDDEIAEYDDIETYTINNVTDWLKLEALSQIKNFEGKNVNVQSPEDNLLGKYNLAGTGFTGLGSASMPFCGTLKTSLSGVSVNCDCPLIAYMSSKATIEQFVLGMSGGNAGIAGTVVFEGDEDTTMLLKGITVTGYLEDMTSDGVGGLFGTVINTTSHKFTIDAATVTQSAADNWGGINMTFSEHDGNAALRGKNVGTFIGKIIGNVTMIVNKDFHINASDGGEGVLPSLYGTEATGSVVGRMEYYADPLLTSMASSQLNAIMGYSANPDLYPTIHFKEWSAFSITNIGGTGYNGGIVGYSDHAKIYNDTANSVLEISDSNISGGKAAGGFIGYAAYTTIDGTGLGEIKVNNSTFECTINTYVNGGVNEGIVGGFIGIYGDGNNLFNGIKITVNNIVITTISYTNSNLKRYLGGLIGKYNSADDIVITPDSEMVTISNVEFKVYSTNTYCGGFISCVPETSGSLYIDTSLTIDNVSVYLPKDRPTNGVTLTSFGGISSTIESDNLTVKNITISGVYATMGRYIGSVAGIVRGEDSVFENLTISDMTISDKYDGVDQTAYYTNKSAYGSGALVGCHKRNAVINNIHVTGMNYSPYVSYGINDNISPARNTSYDEDGSGRGIGGLVGVLGDRESQYTITDISNIWIDGVFDIRYYIYYSITRTYSAGIVGYVYPKTALCLDGTLDLSGITKYTSQGERYTGKLVGYQREALVYMQPTCNVTYNEEVFANRDELGNYGGIYRNETFWDDVVINDSSVSVEGGEFIIEKDPTSVSGIKINGTVADNGSGWGLSTMGDYMRFTIVNNTIGYYGMECFGVSDYSIIASGTFTALNDIDLSKRYMGVLTLNRNDIYEYNNDNFCDAKYHFRGKFKGAVSGEKTKITLPSVDVYSQSNTGGLFATVNCAEFRDLTITGRVESERKYPSNQSGVNGAGALAAISYNKTTVENVLIDGVTINTYNSELNMGAGSLFGLCRNYSRHTGNNLIENVDYVVESISNYGSITPTYKWNSVIKDVTVRNTVINAKNSGNSVYLGGLVGRWYYESAAQTVDFENVNLINTDINSEYTSEGRIGGIVSYTRSTEDRKLIFNFNDVKIDGMDITTASNGETGGFWGYKWNNTDINLTYTNNTDKVVVDNSTLTSTSTGTSTKFGGMIYSYERSMLDLTCGLTIQNTSISAPKSTSDQCSFFISQATTLIMFLKDYRLINTSVEFNGKQFDEIAGVTKNTNELNQLNNIGIVSISDSNPFCLEEENFHVYTYQSDYSKCANLQKPYYNSYTRYYYNLDEIMDTLVADPIRTTTVSYNGVEKTAFDIHTPEQYLMWHILMVIHYNSNYASRMMRYFSRCFDIQNFDNTATSALRNYHVKISGELDMTGLSIYPTFVQANTSLGQEKVFLGADFDNDNAGKGNNKIIFNYDTINQGTNKFLSESEANGTNNCVVMRSSCTTSGYFGASQHSQMHCGLFGIASSINVIDDVSFGGSIGAIQYDASTWYSGAAFCGLLENINVEMRLSNIVLDGLYVVNPKEEYTAGKDYSGTDVLSNWKNYYGMLLAGWVNNNIICYFDTIETVGYGGFITKYKGKKAASALIGRVGNSTVTALKKFEFANMSIADAEEDSVLSANGTNLAGIHATAEDQIMAYASYVYSYQYSQAEQGFYNFDDVCYFYGNGQFDPPSGEKYYITLGKELGSGGVTKTEYYNTSSKVGTASYDTVKAASNSDYRDFKESTADNYWLANFSNENYKPYIYNYEERNINVNYKSGNLLEGCGTYEDPYIITNERQLYSLYCYLAGGGERYYHSYDNDVGESAAYSSDIRRYPQYNNGFKTKLNEWKVNIPGTDDHMCDGTGHIALTYDYETNPVSGFEDELVTDKSVTRKWDKNARITVNLLRNAYYKITADINMSEYEDFYGLCHYDPKLENSADSSKYFPFTGVIIGEKPDGSAPVITMPNFKKFSGTNANMLDYLRSYGFVASAKGCVLKNLDIVYPEDGYAKLGYSTSYGTYNFGGAIGTIWGGDNIIDNVRVSGGVMINHNSFSAYNYNRNYMGGLVGVTYGGGLIFRNLSTDDFADFDFKVTANTGTVQATCKPDLSYTGELNRVGATYDFINGIIGRVFDGYAIVESVDEPKNAVDADGVEQHKLDDSGAAIDFSDYNETDPQKLHAQSCYDLIDAKYLENGAGKIKITRNGYDFETEISNAKQLFVYALTMNSGGFFTSCGSPVDSDPSIYNTYGNSLYHARNTLSHVYHCASSTANISGDPMASYDVYSRCRKAKYDSVGMCDVSNESSAVNEDYRYAKNYDNLMTEKYYETDYTKFNGESYKNYIGYNYMVSKYFDFYEGSNPDQFWIMRRSGLYKNINVTGGNGTNQAAKMHNIYNVYGGADNVNYQGRTNVSLVTGVYDMSVFKQAFRGIGTSYNVSANGNYKNSNTQCGSFYGNNSTVKLGMNVSAGSTYAGLFPIMAPGFSNSSIQKKNGVYSETYPLYEIKDLNLTGYVYNNFSSYRGSAEYAGMLCGDMNNGRYRLSNIHTDNAATGAYKYAGGIVGKFEASTQLLMDNCTTKNTKITNSPPDTKEYFDASLGGLFGHLETSNAGNVNNSYISDNCGVSDLEFESVRNNLMGGLAGNATIHYINIYDFKSDRLKFNVLNASSSCGGFIGKMSDGNYADVKNLSVNDVQVNCEVENSTVKAGGAFGEISSAHPLTMENTRINNMLIDAGITLKDTYNKYFTTSAGAWVGGFAGYITACAIHLDGVYIDNIKMAESEITESDRVNNANGSINRVRVKSSQRALYCGGVAGYLNNGSSSENNLRIVSLTDDKIKTTPTPKPTVRPQYKEPENSYSGEDSFTRPEEPLNPNKGKRNHISNCNLTAEYTGGIIGYVNNNSAYGNNLLNKVDWLFEDIDIEENKIVTHWAYKDNKVSESDRYGSANYISSAGGMFGYLNRFTRGDLYANNIKIEHNVIGTTQNAPSKSCSGGVYGIVAEGENTTADRSGYANYLYNTTLKNNYIGPLDLIKDEEQYYPTTNNSQVYTHELICDFLTELTDAYNKIRTMSIDELGSYSRLYTNGYMLSKDSWDYSVTDPGSGNWYAQDNLYKYSKNVGTFMGKNIQTASTNRRFHTFIVAPKIIYDDTVYSDGEGGTGAPASAHRPAVDVGSINALSTEDDLYAYRDFTHIVYDDANVPVEYAPWDASVANDVVPNALGYTDKHDYLFAQLKNIYDDYKRQISEGYINNAEYDETAHTYRLKDNYGQTENGYTMDEVYDYVYYGYERDVNGNAISASPDYISPYKSKDNKAIPMLVYKAQYGTPDLLMNTIINILTNNAGAYDTNVGYYNANTVSILNVESWKMELKNGEASAVYNTDGTHAQGGFSVTYEDNLPDPPPTTTVVPKPQVRKYALAHTSYDVNKNEKNGTFTVLHITYGWDPKSMVVNGQTVECSEVMTLDIPVFVSKLLEVQINMKTLDGVQLSEHNIALNGSESGTVVLKTTNTVMAEYIYDYPRTMYDSVYLKKKLTFETSPGSIYMHKNTKLTLIDVTDNDKAYYYYFDKTMANPQIPFEWFVDADGNNYKTRDLSNEDDYPRRGTENDPYTDLRGQTWGGLETDENFINDYGIGVERFIIIIDKSATEIDATDQSGYTLHSIHVRVDEDNTETKLMQRIRYDGKNYKDTELNTATEEYPNPDWYDCEVNGYKAYNYINIREIDDVKIRLPNGSTMGFGGLPDEKVGIGPGLGIRAKVDYSLTASANYWNESGKSATDQYLDFVISVQCDNRYVTLPVGTKYSFDGMTWYTIGRDMDYEYGKKQIYYYADRAKKDIENGGDGEAYKLIINKLGKNTSGLIDIFFDFTDCSETSFSDGNYYIKVDAYKTTKREFPVSGDYQDSWISDIYSVYNSSNIGFALQEDDLLYRGINRYLPKVSDNGVIDFKAQLDFRKYLDEDEGEIKDVVTNQYYTIGMKVMKKNSDGSYSDYNDVDNRFKFYYDRSKFIAGSGFGNYDGTVDSDDPMAYGYDNANDIDYGGVTYKFTAEQLNSGSSIQGVGELAFRLLYDTNDLSAEDFSNYKFIAYLYLSENSVSGNEIPDGSSEVLTKEQIQIIADQTADPLSDHLIFTLARLKTD